MNLNLIIINEKINLFDEILINHSRSRIPGVIRDDLTEMV